MKIWAFSNKFVLIVGLVLASQGFAANCAADYVPPENPVWDGSTKTEPCTKDGFYIIDNAAKLAWYAKNYDKGNAKLTADIDLGGKLWTPIAAGQGNAKYSKTFDGNGHVIKNMYINGTELAQIDKNYAQNLGFIGTLGNVKADQPGGTVKNIIFENVDIQASTNAGDILGRDDSQISVGVVVGWMAENNQNVVENCVAASGTIRTTGKGQGVGGIVGNAKNGTISNCLSLVEIRTSGADAYIGGIIGITKTDVTVSSCVYAGPGLVNTGTNGLTGGVVGNVYTGKITTENNYFEGGGSAGVGGSICTKNCNKPLLDSASFNNANTNAQKVNETNVDNVACALNGTNDDGSCKEEPWSVGQTGLSLNGYGADGYKIIFNANEGAFAGNDVTKNIYLASGMTITDNEVGKPSRDGFSFEGWALTANATEPLENLETVSGSEKFYAVWTPVYTITFNVAPGVFPESGESEKTKQVASGDVITVEGLGALPSSRCKVYATEDECETWSYFTGWALTEGASESDSVSLDTVAASDELVLYAVWTDVETYTVTYNANLHGMTTVDYVRVGAGDTVAAPTDPIADTGYVFDGWFTDAEGVNQYQFAAQIHESIILYAKWVLDTFTVAYEMNGVSNAGENPVFYTIETPTFALAAPADSEGYVFEGWFYDANFTQPASQVILGSTGDKTFYAKWSKKKYRIMYLADNNSQGAVTDQFKEHGTPLTLESAGYFNRKGYAQTGWATVANGEKVYEFGATYEENAALTLYPSWSDPIVYTITYVCDGCTDNTGNKTSYTVETPDFSVKSKGVTPPEGYKMAGWYSATDYKTKVEQIKKGSIGDTTLYAKLNKIYKITYVGTDKPYCDTLYTVDDKITLRNPADSAGYIFGGWFTNANFEGDAVTGIAKGSTGDTTFYAKWIPEVETVQYGAITVYTYASDGHKEAVIDGASVDTISIPVDIEVTSVTYNRDFEIGKFSTIMLPFSIDTLNVDGGSFYDVTGVADDFSNATIWHVNGSVTANTPYIVQTTAKNITFTGNVTLKATERTIYESRVEGKPWYFKGSYAKRQFAEGDPELGYAYGFVAKDVNINGTDFEAGTFVKAGKNAWLRPMRAYLVYDPSFSASKSAGLNHGINMASPEEIEVLVVDPQGNVTQRGVLSPVPAESRMDRWYDLQGRRLNSKPETRGTYYHNGKRVIVK